MQRVKFVISDTLIALHEYSRDFTLFRLMLESLDWERMPDWAKIYNTYYSLAGKGDKGVAGGALGYVGGFKRRASKFIPEIRACTAFANFPTKRGITVSNAIDTAR